MNKDFALPDMEGVNSLYGQIVSRSNSRGFETESGHGDHAAVRGKHLLAKTELVYPLEAIVRD